MFGISRVWAAIVHAHDHGALTGLADDDHTQYATNAELTTHEGAADPHTGYVREADANWVDLTDAGETALHTHAGGSGAPADADYLVGTANGTLSNEIVVGTTPNGELGGTWGAITVDTTHSGSSHAGVVTTHEAASDPHTGYVLESLVDAKGDIVTATADNAPARLAVGANDTVLTADSSTATGLKWASPGASSTDIKSAEVDLGVPLTGPGKHNGTFTLTDAGISAGSDIQITLAAGPYTGKGSLADECQMYPGMAFMAVPGSGSATVHWASPKGGAAKGNVKIKYLLG